MPKYVVTEGCSVKHGGRIYNEGETIEMDAKHVYPGLHVVPAGSPQAQVLKQAAAPEGDGKPADDKGPAGNKPGDDKGTK